MSFMYQRAAYVSKFRKAMGWTQSEMGNFFSVSRDTVSKAERAKDVHREGIKRFLEKASKHADLCYEKKWVSPRSVESHRALTSGAQRGEKTSSFYTQGLPSMEGSAVTRTTVAAKPTPILNAAVLKEIREMNVTLKRVEGLLQLWESRAGRVFHLVRSFTREVSDLYRKDSSRNTS